MYTLSVKDKAYFDSFAGMVPCIVLAIDNEGIDVRVTANRGPYKRGEILSHERHGRIVPRTAVRFRKYGTRIYSWSLNA